MSVRVVILCGGQGTRIREVSEVLPKPMVPVGGQPILWHIMKYFACYGFTDFVLCLGYKGWTIKEYFLNYGAARNDVRVHLRSGHVEVLGQSVEDDWAVTLAETGEDTMTGGRIMAIRNYVESDDPFFLTYGDGLADVDLQALLQFHRDHGKTATVTGVMPSSRYGEMAAAEDGRVLSFDEKPVATSSPVSGGFFVLDGRRIWDYLAGGPELIWEHEPLRRLASADQLVMRQHLGFWQAMDTMREYLLLNSLWNRNAAKWKLW